MFKRELVEEHSIVTFNPSLKINSAIIEQLQAKCLNNVSVLSARRGVNGAFPYLDEVREWAKTSIMTVIDPETQLYEYAKHMIHEKQDVHDYILDYLRSAKFNITNIVTNEIIKDNEMVKKTIRAVAVSLNLPPEVTAKLDSDDSLKQVRMDFVHKVENERGIEEYILSSGLQSYGTRRSMGIETAIYRALQQNSLLPIDEFDTSMHPELMEYSIRRFLQSDSKSQLLITTHYDPFLNKIDELIRKDCAWFTEKESSGNTNLYPLVEFKGLHRLSSIQKSYIEGKFGAIPNINLSAE